jgi:putative spermidine/putrescine transport system ATP-binding protein
MTGAELSVRHLSKLFAGIPVVNDVSFSVPAGKLLTLLGPSGCGKTTILRMIAGFIAPSMGIIDLGGIDIAPLPPERRQTAMVFQSYALFPHLKLHANVAFGLRMRGVNRQTINRAVDEALELVQLQGISDRYPHQMSGGQQQRAALARALVTKPKLLLLDEPFGALDQGLREQMQVDVRKIQQSFQITTVFVTHDQQEAFTLSDRVAVMRAGRLEQIGQPLEIYDRPRTRFVAEFMGASNIFEGKVGRINGQSCEILLEGGARIEAPLTVASKFEERIRVALRPTAIRLMSERGESPATLPGTISFRSNLGGRMHFEVVLATGKTVMVEMDRNEAAGNWNPGEPVFVEFKQRECIVLEAS